MSAPNIEECISSFVNLHLEHGDLLEDVRVETLRILYAVKAARQQTRPMVRTQKQNCDVEWYCDGCKGVWA